MNTFWLKIAGLTVVVVGLIILVSVLFNSEPQTAEQPENEWQQQEVGDSELRPQLKVKPRVEDKPNPKVDYVAKINELARAGRDETLNAAPFYQKAIDLYVERGEELTTTLSRRPPPIWPAELSAREQSLLKEWVQSNSQALSQLELGTKKPYYWLRRSSPDGSAMEISLPELNNVRQLSRAITWRAKLNAAQGNNDKVMKDIVTCYRFGLHQMGPKTLVEQLVGIAIRGIAVKTTFIILDRTEMGQASMKSLQRQIEQLSKEESYIPDMRAEKLMMLDIIQRMFTDDGKGNGRIHMEAIKEMLPMPSRQAQSFEKLQRRQTTQAVEKAFEYFDFVVQKTPWQWKNEQIDPEKETKKIMEGNPFVQMFCPALVRVAEIFARVRAEPDALTTTLALLRYKADRGQLPEKLDELVSAGYLKALPTDPCSGRPFVYKRIGGDFMLYSFGTDCDDDGGTHNRRWDKDDQVFWPTEPGLKKSL
jgi:hypothetical protein